MKNFPDAHCNRAY